MFFQDRQLPFHIINTSADLRPHLPLISHSPKISPD